MIRTTYALALALAIGLCLPGIGVVRAADPSINGIGPSVVSVGDPDFSIKVQGENFDKDAVVLLDGAPLPTTFVSKKRLLGTVPVAASAAAGTHTISVKNADGTTTGSETLTVGPRSDVTIDRLNPNTLGVVTSGIGQFVSVSGAGFDENTRVLVFGKEFDTTVRKKDVVEIILPSDIVSVPGLVPFQVKVKGVLSNLLTLPIINKAATIASIDPASVKAGAAAFTLKIVGTGYSPEAKVLIDGVEITPTSIKPQEIKVEVPTSVVAQEGQLTVYVEQETGLSNVFILRVTPADDSPILYSLSPATIQAGIGDVRISITGANFAEKSKVLVNGEEVNTTFVGKGSVTFRLTKEQTDTPGVTYQVQVRNSDGTVTNALPVDVIEAALVSTIAGKKLDGFVDGSPDEAKFRRPSRMALGPDGLIYVADQLNNAIRRLNPANGFVETIAGDGLPGYVDSGDSAADGFSVPRFNNPLGIAVAPDGTIYVADYGNEVIRRIRLTGSGYTVDTIAGANELIKNKDTRDQLDSTRRGQGGFSNGAGTIARFRGVDGMALGSNGTLYIADSINNYIRGLDTTSATFDVSTVSGIGVSGFTDGGSEIARYFVPVDVALSLDETSLFVADLGNNRVRRVDLATGDVSTFAGSGVHAVASGDPLFAAFTGPIGIAVGADGTLYVTDHGSDTIRRVSTEGVTTTLAGGGKSKFKDGIGPVANFKDPRGILYVPALNSLFVADQGHQRIRKIEL